MPNKYAKYRTGSRSVGTNGYVQIGLKDHPLFPGKGFDTEHRVVMAESLGRRLKRREIVHHKDENKQNNARRNLELMTQGKHRQQHRQPCSPETRKRISAAKKGKPTPWLRKYALLNRGRKRSAEFKAKVSAGMKRYRANNPVSAATRQKLSRAMKKRYSK